MADSDAIIVPGGGVRDQGELPSWVRRRLDRTIEIYQGQLIITLSAGTTYRPPPLDNYRFPIFESAAAARYLIDAGVPEESILTETCSYDTIGSAYFARVIHTDPRGLRRLIVITSDFHMPRTEAVFRWIFGLQPLTVSYQLSFESVNDPDMDPKLQHARIEKEARSLAALKNLPKHLTEMAGFHGWLFTQHGAYRAVQAHDWSRLDDLTLQSY